MGFSWTIFQKLFPPGQLKGILVENQNNVPLFWWDFFPVQIRKVAQS